MKDRIIDLLTTNTSLGIMEINNLLALVTIDEYKRLQNDLDELVREGILYYSDKKKKYLLLENSHLQKGVLDLNPKGFGFVEIGDNRRASLTFEKLEQRKGIVGERQVLTTQRIYQDVFRDAMLELYERKCCISGLPIVELLEACHISSWHEDELRRLSPDNGLCLSAFYHKAFDLHFIGIDDDYRVVISSKLKDKYPQDVCRDFFYKYEGKRIFVPKKFCPNKDLLRQHRAKLQ